MTRNTNDTQSLQLVRCGVKKQEDEKSKEVLPWQNKPRFVNTTGAPATLSAGDEQRPWFGKRLDPAAYRWTPTGTAAVGTALANSEIASALSRPEPRKASGLGALLIAIFLGSALLFFAVQAIRMASLN